MRLVNLSFFTLACTIAVKFDIKNRKMIERILPRWFHWRSRFQCLHKGILLDQFAHVALELLPKLESPFCGYVTQTKKRKLEHKTSKAKWTAWNPRHPPYAFAGTTTPQCCRWAATEPAAATEPITHENQIPRLCPGLSAVDARSEARKFLNVRGRICRIILELICCTNVRSP